MAKENNAKLLKHFMPMLKIYDDFMTVQHLWFV